MSKIKLTPKFNFFEKSKLSEIYGSTHELIEFSVLKDNQILFPFVKCKDYIQDFMFSEKNKKNVVMYGFKWEYQNYYDNNEDLIIVCKHTSNKVIRNELIISKRVINNLERRLGFKESKMKSYDNGKIILFYMSNDWYDKPYLLSLYLLILRNGKPFYKKQIKTVINHCKELKFDNNFKQVVPLLNVLYNKTLPENPWEKIRDAYSAHNSGCVIYVNKNKEKFEKN